MEASLDKSIPNAYYTDENHFQNEVSEEDNEKCEGVQKGLSSGAFAIATS